MASSVAFLAVCLPSAADGQTPSPTDQSAPAPAQRARTTVYDAGFFAQFAPRTALDIAQRVPGFTVELGNTEIRGFAGAAGNVVLNGARPSSKSESLETLLSRIPARRVVRVEVGPGDLYGAEYSSKSQVLNIILSSESGLDANLTATAQRRYDGTLAHNLTGSGLLKRGGSSFSLSGSHARGDYTEEGSDTVVRVSDGSQAEHRRKVNTVKPFEPFLSGSWALEEGENRSLRVNARWSPSKFLLTQANHVTPSEGPERDDRLIQDYRTPGFELGGDVTRPFAGGAVKLVGLATRRKRDERQTYLFRTEGGTDILGGFEQLADSKRGETIGRLSWTRGDFLGLAFEAGGEVAWNTLDATLDLYQLAQGGERTRIDLPIDNATVKELRGELFVRGGKQLSRALRLDAGLTFEASRLQVRGDATADRSLRFLKPNLTLDWNSSGWHSQLLIRRTVAQLDFYDFISAAELSTDRVNGGNANLLPQRAWEARALVERPILGDGKARLELGYDHISLLQDRILTPEGFDAPGNIGTGRRQFASLTIDAPIDALGISGGRAKLQGQLQRTRVEDPIWGEMREFSGYYPSWEWRADLRRDVGNLAYGVSIMNRDSFTFFRTDELDTSRNTGPFAFGFIEYRPTKRMSVTLEIDNLLNTGAERERILFSPNRSNPSAVAQDLRERNIHRTLGITVKHSFGGGSRAEGP